MAVLLAVIIQAPLGGARGIEGIEVTKPPWLGMIYHSTAAIKQAIVHISGVAIR